MKPKAFISLRSACSIYVASISRLQYRSTGEVVLQKWIHWIDRMASAIYSPTIKGAMFQQQGFPCISSLSVEHHYSRRQFTRSRPILRRQKRSLDRHCSQNSPPLHWTSFQVRNRYCMCWASQHDALHLVILRLPFISGDVILFDRRQIHVRRDGHDSRSLGR